VVLSTATDLTKALSLHVQRLFIACRRAPIHLDPTFWQLYTISTSTIAIVIITQSVSSFFRPAEGGRLSRPRHCKGAQPVPRLYIAVAVMINHEEEACNPSPCPSLFSPIPPFPHFPLEVVPRALSRLRLGDLGERSSSLSESGQTHLGLLQG